MNKKIIKRLQQQKTTLNEVILINGLGLHPVIYDQVVMVFFIMMRIQSKIVPNKME